MKTTVKILSVLFAAIILVLPFNANTLAANYKSSLSEYAGQGSLKLTKKQICSFDSADMFTCSDQISAGIDTSDKKEGTGCLLADTSAALGNNVVVFNAGFDPIDCTKKNGRTVTFKLWININDMEKLSADHETLYDYDYSDFGTVYLRASSSTGENHAINQTIRGSGWQEIEFSFEQDNGISSDFDRSAVTGFFMAVRPKESGLTVKVDDLRVCTYTNEGYTPDNSGIPDGARLISYCDYDSLSGDLINEWFNSDYSSEIKKFGSSSYHIKHEGGDDERMFWGDIEIPLDKENDMLCFWMYMDNLSSVKSFFLELNQIQDKHEYQKKLSVTEMVAYAPEGFKLNSWVMIQIPISIFTDHFEKMYGDSVTAKHLRFGATLKPDADETNIYMDNVCIATKSQVKSFNKEYLASLSEDSYESPGTLRPQNGGNQQNNGNTSANTKVILIAAILGGAVLISATAVVAAVIIKKKRTVGKK